MEKFKITNLVKREVAKKVKSFIGGSDYSECAIIYLSQMEEFIVVETGRIEEIENKGGLLYKLFEYYKVDGKLTLKEIENKIFN